MIFGSAHFVCFACHICASYLYLVSDLAHRAELAQIWRMIDLLYGYDFIPEIPNHTHNAIIQPPRLPMDDEEMEQKFDIRKSTTTTTTNITSTTTHQHHNHHGLDDDIPLVRHIC